MTVFSPHRSFITILFALPACAAAPGASSGGATTSQSSARAQSSAATPTTTKSTTSTATTTTSTTTSTSGGDDPVTMLVARSQEANDALMRGDGPRYGALVPVAADFTLMSPFGGTPKAAGAPSPERLAEIGRFFKNGRLRQELVHAYYSPDMITLATIEHAHGVEVGGLPAQDWSLRVTLVYRRVGSEWQLIHRHADPLAHGISVAQAAVLGRGAPPESPSR